jgi:hypothetical protein
VDGESTRDGVADQDRVDVCGHRGAERLGSSVTPSAVRARMAAMFSTGSWSSQRWWATSPACLLHRRVQGPDWPPEVVDAVQCVRAAEDHPARNLLGAGPVEAGLA